MNDQNPVKYVGLKTNNQRSPNKTTKKKCIKTNIAYKYYKNIYSPLGKASKILFYTNNTI